MTLGVVGRHKMPAGRKTAKLTRGDGLLDKLQGLRDHRIIGDVRGGLGVFAALELVKDRGTREHFPKSAGLDRITVRATRRHGMLGRAGTIIPIAPPAKVISW